MGLCIGHSDGCLDDGLLLLGGGCCTCCGVGCCCCCWWCCCCGSLLVISLRCGGFGWPSMCLCTNLKMRTNVCLWDGTRKALFTSNVCVCIRRQESDLRKQVIAFTLNICVWIDLRPLAFSIVDVEKNLGDTFWTILCDVQCKSVNHQFSTPFLEQFTSFIKKSKQFNRNDIASEIAALTMTEM